MLHQRLIKMAKNIKGHLLLTTAAGCVLGMLILIQSFLVARIVNQGFLGGWGLKELQPFFAGLLIVILLRSLIFWSRDLLAHQGASKFKEDLQQQLLARIFALGPIYGRQQDAGYLINTITEGVESLQIYFSRYLPALALAAIVPLGILIVVLPRDLLTGFIFLCTAPLIPLFMILIGNMAEAKAQKQWSLLGRINSHFLDVLEGLPTLKLLQKTTDQGRVIAQLSKKWTDSTMGVLRIAFLSAFFLEFFATISTAMVAVFLGLRLIHGTITFEAAFFLLLLAPEFYGPLRNLGTHYHSGLAGTKAAASIFAILDTPLPQRKKGNVLAQASHARRGITMTRLSFTYPGEKQALKNISLTINPGEKVALVGPSGAGKSTILHLLMGFLEAQAGEIRVGAIPLKNFNRESWRRQVALVPQNPYFFHGTIKDNIALGKPRASMKEIKQAAANAAITAVIASLPQGYDTVIGKDGRNLSGGQRQRLAIARAFLMDTPLVLLDEATASLDRENEGLIQNVLKNLLTGKTALLVAHRLSTLEIVDRILVLEAGSVVEEGTHRELLARKGVYYQLRQAYEGVAP